MAPCGSFLDVREFARNLRGSGSNAQDPQLQGTYPERAPAMLVALLIAGQLSAPRAAEPPGDPLELSWEAPAGCPGSEHVRMLVRAMSPGAPPRARVRARVAPRGSGFAEALEITVAGVVEQRALEGETCLELARATALLVAIALDPIAAAEALDERTQAGGVPEPPVALAPDERASGSPVATPVAGSADASRRRPEARGARPRWRIDGNGVAGASWGAVPGATGLVGAALGVERRVDDALGLRLALDGRYAIPTLASYPDRPGLSAAFDLWALGPKGCLSPQARRLSLPVCAGVELGGLRARASGTADARTDRSPWVAATLDASLRWRIRGAWVASAGLGIGIPLRRDRFHFDLPGDPARPLHAVAPLTLTTLLGIGLQRP